MCTHSQAWLERQISFAEDEEAAADALELNEAAQSDDEYAAIRADCMRHNPSKAARRALDAEAPVTAWGGFEVGGWGDDDADVRAAPPPKKRPKHRYDAWDRSLDAPRRGHWDD